jgi:hypothetical protein
VAKLATCHVVGRKGLSDSVHDSHLRFREEPVTKPPHPVTIARLLIALNALIWLGFGLILASGAHPAVPDSAFLRWIMVIGGLLAGAALAVLALLLGRPRRWVYLVSLTALAVLAALSIADQVGLADLAVLALELAAIACLLRGRAWFTPALNAAGLW